VQGVSFASILVNPAATTRDYVFAEHNWHVFQAHERMVRHGDWIYIRNGYPHLQSLCTEADPSFPAGEELWAMEAAGKLDPATQRDIFLIPRPADELYRISKDPHQLVNLVGKPEHAPVMEKLKALLDRWADETGDTVPANPTPDRDVTGGEKKSAQPRGAMPGEERGATKINHPGPIRE
jgi:arylsulfatase